MIYLNILLFVFIFVNGNYDVAAKSNNTIRFSGSRKPFNFEQNSLENKILAHFIIAAAKESNSSDLTLISSPDIVQDLDNCLLAVVRYNIESFELNDIYDFKAARVKYNKQPLYFVMSSNISAVLSVAEMIRSVDPSNTIMAFTDEYRSIYNTYFITKTTRDEILLNEVCMYCNHGKDVMSLANTWKMGIGFSSMFKPAKSFKNQFYGKELVYVCYAAYVFEDGLENRMRVLEEKLNFTVKLAVHVTWQLQELLTSKDKELLFGGCYQAMTHPRYQFADFSYIYRTYGMKIYSIKPERGLVWYAFAQPYQYPCWILIIFSIPICGLVIYLFYKFDKNVVRGIGLGDSIWIIICILSWDSIRLKNRPWKVCFFLMTYMLGTYVVVSNYFGEVTSFMTAKPYLWPPMDSLEQFKKSSMSYLVKKGLYEENMFMNDSIMEKKKIYVPNEVNKSNLYNYVEKPLEMVVNNPKDYAIIATSWESTIDNYYMDTNGNHDFHISKEDLSLMMTGFFFRKGSLYQEAFNIQMMKLWEAGIMQHFNDIVDYREKLTNLKNAQKLDREPPFISDKIRVVDMTSGFVLLSFGLILSFIALGLEYIVPEDWVEEYKRFMGDWEELNESEDKSNDVKENVENNASHQNDMSKIEHEIGEQSNVSHDTIDIY